ncbi:MAG: glycosyltransferase family 4 protein [Candidatus Pacebacteria bacterium]|nr:glycosyltransferase family 4 protein [Candidatus Paceibacterota bacterium]
MKILIATGIYPPEVGGPATYSKLMYDRLPAFGWEVEVLPFRVVGHLPKIIRHLAYAWEVFVRAGDVDVVYAQDVGSVGVPALIGTKLRGTAFAVRVPGDYAWETASQKFGVTNTIDDFQNRRYGFFVEVFRLMERTIVRYADLVITPSDYFTKLVSRWAERESKIPVKTVYNGIESPESLPSRDEARNALGIASDDKLILSAGRLVPWKGFPALIDVVVDLHATDPRWRLIILGDDPERWRLEHIIVDRDAGDYVTLAGDQRRDKMFAYCRAADVFALNSSFESFSFQTVEVMRTETPFVGTNIGSLPELVTNGHEGILLTPDDREGFKNAIVRMMDDRAFRDGCVAAALEKSRTFSIDRTLQETSALLKQIYEGKR